MNTKILALLGTIILTSCSDGVPEGWVKMRVSLGQKAKNQMKQIQSLYFPKNSSRDISALSLCTIPHFYISIYAPDLDTPITYYIDDASVDLTAFSSGSTGDTVVAAETYEILVPEGDQREIAIEGVFYGLSDCRDATSTAYPFYGITAPMDVGDAKDVSIDAVIMANGFNADATAANINEVGTDMIKVTYTHSSIICNAYPPVIEVNIYDYDNEATMSIAPLTISGATTVTFGLLYPRHAYDVNFTCANSSVVSCTFFAQDTAGEQLLDSTECL